MFAVGPFVQACRCHSLRCRLRARVPRHSRPPPDPPLSPPPPRLQLVQGLMQKLLLQLVAELQRLGATVVHADCGSIILATGKRSPSAAVGCVWLVGGSVWGGQVGERGKGRDGGVPGTGLPWCSSGA